MLESFLIKLQALRTATVSKKDSCKTCDIFKNTLFYWTSSAAASYSFRFPACNFIKKEIAVKMFFCEFCEKSTSGWLLLKFICEFWEVFQNIFYRPSLRNCLFYVQVAVIQPADRVKNYFTGAIQAFYTRTRSSHSKAFNSLKFYKIIGEEVNL